MSTTATPPNTLIALWDDFLARWPLESLRTMSLDDYTQAGNKDCFTYWLESRTEDLGSIWGGSAFKFGVYSRRDQSDKSSSTNSALAFSPTHGWLSKYGATAEQAFERVRSIVADVASAAREGRLDAVEAADLGHATKWKIAFLYQDRANPQVLPIFNRAMLDALPGVQPKDSTAQVQRQLIQRMPAEQTVLGYGQALWTQAERVVDAAVSSDEVLAFLQAFPGLAPIKEPTQKHAGFRLRDGRELCLLRSRKTPVLYLQPGPWSDDLPKGRMNYTLKTSADTRSNGLDANAPSLAAPHPAASFAIPDRECLLELMEAYTGEAAPPWQGRPNTENPAELRPTSTAAAEQFLRQPLNQILYGPPGTGKTYSTIDAALAVLDPAYLAQHRSDRSSLKSRFDSLVQDRRIRFVTFHQSFSYEDFVEGLRAITNEDTGQIRYEVVDGVFKSLCEAAAARVTLAQGSAATSTPIDVRGRRIWKMSLGNTLGSDAAIYDECIESGYALLGSGGGVDFSGCASRAEVLKRFEANGLTVENPQTDYAVTSITTFVTRMKPGDLLIVSDGNFKFRAIGEVSGEYQHRPRSEFADEYTQMRAVKWLRTYEPSLPHGELMNNQFSQMTLYELRPGSIDLDKLQRLLGGQAQTASSHGALQLGPVGSSDYKITQVTQELVELTKPNGNRLHFSQSLLRTLVDGVRAGALTVEDIRDKQAIARLPGQGLEPYIVNGYANVLAPLVEQMLGQAASMASAPPAAVVSDARVLIIDEINRGNVSRIFGELITLIESSKRAGADEALEVVLPYSKKPFSVPSNVYLIGTMNTADRSLTGLDVALRRRFEFREMPPRPGELKGINVDGIEVDRLLDTMNQRIEALLDRDHRLGHAYFMPLREKRTLARLEQIFRNQVLPLLQEYFFDDWQRIQWVLNDHRKAEDFRFVRAAVADVAGLFGIDVNVTRNAQTWTINDLAFKQAQSYLGIIDHRDAQDDDA